MGNLAKHKGIYKESRKKETSKNYLVPFNFVYSTKKRFNERYINLYKRSALLFFIIIAEWETPHKYLKKITLFIGL